MPQITSANGMTMIFVYGVCLILIFAIIIWIGHSIKAKRPCDLYEIAKKTLQQITYDEVTDNMSHEEIYRKDGQIRANVQKKIDAQYDRNLDELGNYFQEYVYMMKDFLISENVPQIMYKDAKLAHTKLYKARLEYQSKARKILDCETGAITPKEFFIGKQQQTGDCVGVYIIHNKTKDMYYVGQATRLYFRVNQHFTGHGNGDVYADYKYGDEFTIKLIKLTESGYDDLDKLEKAKIREYNAYTNGYNKTAGNGK